MKRILISLICLALLSLACLQTAVIAEEVSVATSATFIKVTADPTRHIPGESTGTFGVTPSPNATNAFGEGSGCAVVIANEALHLRAEPNEHAVVLAWLKHGDQVQVISTSNADWWLVQVGELVGFARSVYLWRESECQ